MIPYNKALVDNARELRKNMTPEEKHLWYDFLKGLPYNASRQHNIENFIVDFYIAEKKIVIELDGIQHTSYEYLQKDKERDTKLLEWGITVLRYSNETIRREFNWVCSDILKHLDLKFADLRDCK